MNLPVDLVTVLARFVPMETVRLARASAQLWAHLAREHVLRPALKLALARPGQFIFEQAALRRMPALRDVAPEFIMHASADFSASPDNQWFATLINTDVVLQRIGGETWHFEYTGGRHRPRVMVSDTHLVWCDIYRIWHLSLAEKKQLGWAGQTGGLRILQGRWLLHTGMGVEITDLDSFKHTPIEDYHRRSFSGSALGWLGANDDDVVMWSLPGEPLRRFGYGNFDIIMLSNTHILIDRDEIVTRHDPVTLDASGSFPIHGVVFMCSASGAFDMSAAAILLDTPDGTVRAPLRFDGAFLWRPPYLYFKPRNNAGVFRLFV